MTIFQMAPCGAQFNRYPDNSPAKSNTSSIMLCNAPSIMASDASRVTTS